MPCIVEAIFHLDTCTYIFIHIFIMIRNIIYRLYNTLYLLFGFGVFRLLVLYVLILGNLGVARLLGIRPSWCSPIAILGSQNEVIFELFIIFERILWRNWTKPSD